MHNLLLYSESEETHDIVYNVKKSMCMVINSAKYKIINLPRVYLAGVLLEYVERYKYLGMIIHVRNHDSGPFKCYVTQLEVGGCQIFWKKTLRRCNVQCY